jgi:hypothetical protein
MHEETKPRHWVVLGLACQGTSRDRWTRQQGIGSCLAWLAKALVVIAGQGNKASGRAWLGIARQPVMLGLA